jgi:hypothetical protein
MSIENACPFCGARLPSATPHPPRTPASELVTEGPSSEIAAIPLVAPGSNDDIIAKATRASRSSDFLAPRPSAETLEPFAALRIQPDERPGRTRTADPEKGYDDGSEDVRGGTSWSTVALASYASAITLAFVFLMYRQNHPSTRDVGSVETDEKIDAPRQADLSKAVALPDPIPPDRRVGLGKTIQLGELEIQPIEVKRERVTLVRQVLGGGPSRRDGGDDAFVLRLRLRNTSKDSVFAPLDQAFIREADDGNLQSFIEGAAGRRVYLYPLAVASEWSILGQDFSALRPGESRMFQIISGPDVPSDLLGPFTWRLRLRTGLDRTDLIGVQWE